MLKYHAVFLFVLAKATSASLNAQNAPLNLLCVYYWAPQDASAAWIKIKEDGLSGKMISGNTNTKGWEKTQNESL